MDIASQTLTEEKFAKQIKSGMRDKSVSRNIRVLQTMGIIAGIILIIMTCINFHYKISRPILSYIQQCIKCKNDV